MWKRFVGLITCVTAASSWASPHNQFNIETSLLKNNWFPSVTYPQHSCIQYPETRKGNVIDTYFGIQVADPYRWLEDLDSQETKDWVTAENEVTFDYLEGISYRDQLKTHFEDVWNYEKMTTPFTAGEYTYFSKNDGLQNQYVLWRQKGNEAAEVFLDPNTLSEDGTIAFTSISFSKDGSYASYAVSDSGSDWRNIIIIDTKTKETLDEPLVNVKFSNMLWKGSEGFYYSAYDRVEETGQAIPEHKLYFHKLGQNQSEDNLIFGGTPEQKRRYVSSYVTDDDHYLVITSSQSSSGGNDLFIQDLTKPDSPMVTIMDDFSSNTYLLDNDGSNLFLVTDLNAPNYKLVTVDIKNPSQENWQDFIAETENVLEPSYGGGYIFAHYMVDANSKIDQYDYAGNKIREIELPGKGTASGFDGDKGDKTLYYTFTNYKTPTNIYAFDVDQGLSNLYFQPPTKFNSDDYETKQVFYHSKDGTRVPMTITHKKGIKLDGHNPTLLYGYGGFNISILPEFRIFNSVWMELGGVYAVPNIRGGGEYGKDWHTAGTQLNKQNVFDDFIAAAEYLIEEHYTSSQYLAIQGSSNGGLLVGAVMTQRPDLMKVALPNVGVMDMLRYHLDPAGSGWAYDYGTSEDNKEMFEYLLNYSPVHNVFRGIEYPATLVTASDHDDRVVPSHSYKFAAELQDKQPPWGPPVLIRVETNTGHGAGTPTSKLIQSYADVLSFTLFNMGIESLPTKF